MALMLLAMVESLWLALYGVLWVSAVRHGKLSEAEDSRYDLAAPFRYLGAKVYQNGRMPYLLHRIRQTMAGLHGDQQSVEATKRLLGRMAGTLYGAGLGANTTALAAGGDQWTAAAAWLFALLAAYVPFHDAERKWKRKQQAIRLELPVVLSKMLMLIEAGETMQRALLSSAAAGREDHPLYAELIRLQQRIEQQTPLLQALEELSRRCPQKEIRLFVNALSLNHRRGGDQLTQTLRELSARLWAERQTQARILGEEASSKLLFPMAALFLVVMVIVAAPAVMLMGT